jgi:CHAT domain-containing protein
MSPARYLAVAVTLAMAASGGHAQRAGAQTPQAAEATLTPGVEMTGDVDTTPARFRFALADDEAMELRVTQPGVNLELRLVDASGADVMTVDVRHHTQGDERLIAAAPAGSYVLVIAPAATVTAASATRFSILSSRRRATETDRRWYDGARAFANGAAQQARGTGDAFRFALASFEAARDAWSAAGWTLEAATAVSGIALMQILLSQLQDAVATGEAALALWRSVGDRYGEGRTLSDLASTFFRLGDHSRAAELYDQAVALRRTVDDPAGLGYSLMGLAVTRSRAVAGWLHAAVTYQEALELFERAGDRQGQAAALYNLGYACKQRNDFAAALGYFDRAMAVRRSLNDLGGQASVLTQVAAIHLRLGDAQRALEVAEDAVVLRRQSGDRRGEAYSVLTAGMALTRLGQLAPALERLTAALALAEAVGDREGQSNVLAHMARLRAMTGAPAEALALTKRAHAVAQGQDTFDATVVASVAGDAHLALGDRPQAAVAYTRGLAIAERLGESLPAAEALAGLGRVARGNGDLLASRGYLLEAVDRIESVRAGVAQSELRALFLGVTQNAYEAAIDTLVALHQQQPSAGYAAEALVLSERRRARTLVELLAEAQTDLRADVDRALLDREDAIQRRLNARAAARAAATGADRTSADREISDLVADLRAARADIRRHDPGYAAVTYAPELDVAGVQKLLDARTLLLEYSLGEHQSYLWAITPTTMTLHILPGRQRIEDAVRRARELIAGSARRGVRGPLQRALADLSAMLLGDVGRQLAGHRLAIVADGALQFVPFAALPRPYGDPDAPLIVDHEVVMLPSAAVLHELRQERRRTRGTKTIAVIADPVLQLEDPRLAPGTRSEPVSSEDATLNARLAIPRSSSDRASAENRGAEFARLAYAGEEARAIAAKARGDSLMALGFDATRDLVVSAPLRDFRMVHLATHAVVDTRHPELTGIVLTLLDRDGAPVDGFLRLHDIFNLRLGASTVVLSACETALGTDIRGEGLIGLTRGFMHAGASQLVASLWNVNDRATAALMTAFYTGAFDRRLSPAAALRAAQLEMWKNPRWRMPVYWAGFTVQGDWRPGSF